MVSMFLELRVDRYCSIVRLTSSSVTWAVLAVITFWLQNTQSLGQPLWGMKTGIIACFFMGQLYHIFADDIIKLI